MKLIAGCFDRPHAISYENNIIGWCAAAGACWRYLSRENRAQWEDEDAWTDEETFRGDVRVSLEACRLASIKRKEFLFGMRP